VNGLNLGDVQVQGIARRDTNIERRLHRHRPLPGAGRPRPDRRGQQGRERPSPQATGQVTYSGVSVVGSKVSGELFTSGLLALGSAILS
jgi:preprotein translocase subunit SecF